MWMTPTGMFYPARIVSKNLDFRKPVWQPLPTTAAGLAALMVNLGEPDSIHTFDESSSPAIDHVGSNNLTYNGGPLLQQRAVGLSDNSGSLTSRRCVEFEINDSASLSNPGFNPGTGSFAHLLVWRTPTLSPPNERFLLGARDSSSPFAGYELEHNSSGGVFFRIDGGASTASSTVNNSHFPGAWMACLVVVDRIANTSSLYVSTNATGDTADITGFGSLSASTADFTIGDGRVNNHQGLQVAYHAYWSGSAAEGGNQEDLDSFWVLGSDPTDEFDTATHASRVLIPVGYESGFGPLWHDYSGDGTHGRDQMPLYYSDQDDQLGVYCNSAITNIIPENEDFTTWTTSGPITVTANNADSPRGFREATLLDQTGSVGYITASGSCSANTFYSLSVWIQTPDSDHDVRIVIRNHDDTAARSIQEFSATSEGAVFTGTFSTAAGQTNLPIRIYGGTDSIAGQAHVFLPTIVDRSELSAVDGGVYDVLIPSSVGTQEQTFYRLNSINEGGTGISGTLDPRKGEVLVDLLPFPSDGWTDGLRVWEARKSDTSDPLWYAGHSNAAETPRYVLYDDGGTQVLANNSDQSALTNQPYTWLYVWDFEKNLPGVGGTTQIFVDGVQQFDSPPTNTWTTSGDDVNDHRFAVGCAATGGSQFPCSIRRIKIFRYLPPAFLPPPDNFSLAVASSSSQAALITDASQNGVLDLTGSFTIEAWVQFDSATAAHIIASKFGTTGNQSYACYWQSSGGPWIRFRIGDVGGNEDYVQWSFTPATDGTWYHMAFVFDSSVSSTTGNSGLNRLQWYLDGSNMGDPASNENSEVTPVDGDADFVVGAWDLFGSTQDFFDGHIDDVRVWNVVRTESEINNNKDAELNGNEANLVGYWKFNEDFTDATSNGNDLTGHNSPTFSEDTPF